jgi:hypothetical protein
VFNTNFTFDNIDLILVNAAVTNMQAARIKDTANQAGKL